MLTLHFDACDQAGRHQHNESYSYYTDLAGPNMTEPDGRADDLR